MSNGKMLLLSILVETHFSIHDGENMSIDDVINELQGYANSDSERNFIHERIYFFINHSGRYVIDEEGIIHKVFKKEYCDKCHSVRYKYKDENPFEMSFLSTGRMICGENGQVIKESFSDDEFEDVPRESWCPKLNK